MKIRTSFVSNSSSSSFLIKLQNVSDTPKKVLDILKDNIVNFNDAMDCGSESGTKYELIDYWIGAFRKTLPDEVYRELDASGVVIYTVDTMNSDEDGNISPIFYTRIDDMDIEPTEMIIAALD